MQKLVKNLVKCLGGSGALALLMLTASHSFAGVGECQCAPEDKSILDCQALRTVVLSAVRQKNQQVSLVQGGESDQRTAQFNDANSTYKDFLHWTAARDSVTIANLLSKSSRATFDPTSFEAEGYAVSWLNIPAVDMEMYYDEFTAQQSGRVVMTRHNTETSAKLAKRD